MKRIYYILFYTFLSFFTVCLYGCQNEELDEDEEPTFPSGRHLLEVKTTIQDVIRTYSLDSSDLLKTDTTKTTEYLLYRFDWKNNLVASYDEYDKDGSKTKSFNYSYDGSKLTRISGTFYGKGSSVPFSYDVKNDQYGRISSFKLPLGPGESGADSWSIVYGSNDRIAEMNIAQQEPLTYKLTWDNLDVTKIEIYREESAGNSVLQEQYDYEYCNFKNPYANMNLLCPCNEWGKSENCVTTSYAVMQNNEEVITAHSYVSYGGYPEEETRVTTHKYSTSKNYIEKVTTACYVYIYSE